VPAGPLAGVARLLYTDGDTRNLIAAGSSVAESAIAIDGPVASGKSSVGSRVAAALGWPFVDTGTMYRAITWLALHRGLDVHDLSGVSALAEAATMRVRPPAAGSTEYATVQVDGEDATPYLRTPPVERSVSVVSAMPRVRRRMVSLQRELAADHPVVMAGRDIGTVVLPDAALKIFLDASPETRAQRRAAELARRGHPAPPGAVLAETLERDRLDSERADSPLVAASDAVVLKTDGMSEDEVVARVLALARQRFGTQVQPAR
jgi:cytidylate kinase